jgi:exopolysaccharide biosynthesis operon protein EpsL
MHYNELMKPRMQIESRAMPRWTPLMLAALLYCNGAAAEISDTIHPIVAIGYTYDDNLLRLPDDAVGVDQRSDRMTQTQAGILFDRTFGRQRLSGRAKVLRVTFDHFDQLDYNGKDAAADLAWQLGNHLNGAIGGTYLETLTPFSDSHSADRNLRTQRTAYANGAWRFHPSWQVRAGVTRYQYAYELAVQRVNNRTERLAEAGFDYLARSGSKIGLVARQWKGTYDNPRLLAGVRLDDDYTQNELKANVNWLVSAVTQVNILAGYARREHDLFTNRDSSGANGRVSVKWAPLSKVRFGADVWREFSAVESNLVTNSLNTGASLDTTWDISSHFQATANVRREKRDFEESGLVVFDGSTSDHKTMASAGLVWVPRTNLQLSLSVFKDKRDGSAIVGTNDYRAKGAAFNASAQF